MALALDAILALLTSWGTGVSAQSRTLTTSGSNRFLVAAFLTYNSSSLITVSSATYGGVALTRANGISAALESAHQNVELWYLDNPALGNNTLLVNYSGTASFANYGAISYTGKTTTGLESSNATQNTSTSTSGPSCPDTITHTDCWITSIAYSRFAGTLSAGTGTTFRSSNALGHAMGDSNGVVATGSQTLAFNSGSAVTWPGIVSIAFSAANAGGGSTATCPLGSLGSMGVGV